MLENTLTVLGLAGSGLTAGVLLAVAISVVPAMAAVSPQLYVRFHQLLGRNWDPTMPVIVLASALTTATLAVVADGTAARSLFGLGAALLVGVSGVSHLLNVPLNRQVKGLDPDAPLPAEWRDPRAVWRRWHLLRTGLAIAALLVNALATVA
ncbi:anthrone oxygenase family protein [Actinomadura roseirufa]|uniref:anthrone oxygenase family protein n=1 Tax=Actinomadura roseirufa TaxID=2094049 RepID=UPI0010416BF4|nr:DUF1772 domain-containing protein [Actinomadura roseirufa]